MDRVAEATQFRQLISSPDVVVGSLAAVTETGCMVAASATGFQIPAYAGGIGHVILVVGAQKIVPDLAAAMNRLESYVLPLEDARAMAACGVHSALNRVLVLNGEPFGRVTFLLLREVVGYCLAKQISLHPTPIGIVMTVPRRLVAPRSGHRWFNTALLQRHSAPRCSLQQRRQAARSPPR